MSLREKALSGFAWSSIGTLGNGLVSFLVTVILSRILTPNDFALIALMTVFVAISNVIVDSGFSQAIIRDENASDEDLSSVFLFNMFISILLYFVLFLSSPAIASFYNAPELVLLSRVVFLVIIFNASIIIQNAILKRNLNFALVEKASVVGTLCSGIISVLMALFGLGMWALVANMVLMPFFRGILLWQYSNWKPTLKFSLSSIKKYSNFGVFLMLQGIIDVVVTNLNTMFIGKIYTKDDLGYYSQGGKFDSYVVAPLGTVIDKVIYPVFAKFKNDNTKLRDGYTQMLGILLFIVFPIMLFISVNSKNVITFFFGSQWLEAGIYLQLLSILGLFQLLHKTFVNLILVKGQTKAMFYFAVIKQLLRIISLLLTIRISVYAMTLGFVISGIIGSLLYIGLGMYQIRYSIKEFILDNYKTIVSTLFALSGAMFISIILPHTCLSIMLILQCIVMATIYVSLNYIVNNKNLNMIIVILRSVFRKQ